MDDIFIEMRKRTHDLDIEIEAEFNALKQMVFELHSKLFDESIEDSANKYDALFKKYLADLKRADLVLLKPR